MPNMEELNLVVKLKILTIKESENMSYHTKQDM